ncbi:MAG TPA: ATP-dependent RecD-like DNA helicase, partial [Bacillota bacterium]|nr:ATP-dependent RecD-like DNA helicase [Bacillota bacterium]
GRIYREGDRVMQTKNNYMMSWRDVNSLAEGSGIFNGELGIIREVDNEYGRISVLFDGEKLAVYDYAAIEELETAFAMTVHKSQGSEFPIAVIPIGRFPPMLANRNLLYTAITRATTAVVLVGRPRMLCAMVDNDSTDRRNSGLAARLEALWGIMS